MIRENPKKKINKLICPLCNDAKFKPVITDLNNLCKCRSCGIVLNQAYEKIKYRKDYFTEDSLLFFESGDSKSLAEVIYKVYSDPKNYKTIISKGIQIYKKFTWKAQKKHFTKIVSNLIKK